MNYSETVHYLFEQLPMFHRVGPAAYKPGLDNTIALLKAVGNPEVGLRCIHVAGTNGKGSTSHLLASILQSAGYKVGLYTSPHLKDFRERIKINGQMIGEDHVVDFVKKYKHVWAEIEPSFFEITVAMCFDYFKSQHVDVAVIETGLGGRLDSTNVIQPLVSVITNVSLDHMNLLGNTISEIAFEKAGIIKKNVPVVLGPMLPDALQVMLQKAESIHAPFYQADASLLHLFRNCPLTGLYQQQNFQTVGKTVEVLRDAGFVLPDAQIQRGIELVTEQTGLLGRWQILGNDPLVVADVAHNEDGVRWVVQQLRQQSFNRLHVVLGMVADKDVSLVLKLLPTNAQYYFCKANIPRGLDANQLLQAAAQYGLMGNAYESVPMAFEVARQAAQHNDMIFVGGSVFTVAEVL